MTADELKDAAARNPGLAYRAAGYAEKLTQSGGKLVGLCPFHSEQKPSFTIFPDAGFQCFGCGAQGSIIDFYLMHYENISNPTQEDCTPEVLEQLGKLLGLASAPEQRQVWQVKTAEGEIVAEHVRIDPGKRIFWQRGGSPGLDGLKTTELPLYGIDRLVNATTSGVIVTEGEKAADACWRKGFPAVGTVTGANKIPEVEVLRPLADYRIYLWPDNDDVGRQHMDGIARLLV
ncbi:MAG: CHC2 zinc finger domain-containing protein, partial [Armatimonadota bacterium]